MLVQIIYVSPSRNNTHLASTRQYKDPGRVQRLYPQLFTVYSTPPANTRTPVKYSDSIHNCSLSTPTTRTRHQHCLISFYDHVYSLMSISSRTLALPGAPPMRRRKEVAILA